MYLADLACNKTLDKKLRYQINQGASLVLFDENFVYFLLTKQKKWKQQEDGTMIIKFSGIGGGVESNETPYENLVREVTEETSLTESSYEFINNLDDIILLNNKDKSYMKSKEVEDKIKPVCVYQKVMPLRDDMQKIKDKFDHSYLQLFIYFASLKEIFTIKEKEHPAILKLPKKSLAKYVSNDNVVDIDSLKDIQIIINNEYVQEFGHLPKKFILSPQFTPKAISNILENMNFLNK